MSMDALKKNTSEGTEIRIISQESLEEQLKFGRIPGNEVGQGTSTEKLISMDRTIDKSAAFSKSFITAPLDLQHVHVSTCT